MKWIKRMFNKDPMTRTSTDAYPLSGKGWKVCLTALLSLMLLSVTAFGQTAASLGGTVMDSTRAVIPGAAVLAVNEDTGVETRTTSNNSGVYAFPSLQAGTYRVTVEASGFQSSTMTGVKMGAGSQNNVNFDLAVAGSTESISVTASAENMILEAGSSTGAVLQENLVDQMPVFTGNALELVNLMGGVVAPPASTNPLFAANDTTFAGVSAQNINITRDGISQNEVRYNSGVQSATRMNPDVVGEFKMVLSPVDAELGRGAGQVQMTTRSGTNTFHGSAIWNIQNTALDANEWQNKTWGVINRPPWRNLNNYSLTASGPIIQNRTFFFASWDQQWAVTKTPVNTTVLTNCARKGIYRYLENVTSTNALETQTNPLIEGATRTVGGQTVYAIGVTRPGVWDGSDGIHKPGEPRLSYTFDSESRLNHTPSILTDEDPNNDNLPIDNPHLFDGTTDFTNKTVENRLMYNSILGDMNPALRMALGGTDSQYAVEGSWVYNGCPDDGTYSIQTGSRGFSHSWDYYRRGVSNHGFVTAFTDLMPPATDFNQTGDGLNTATRRWTRSLRGNDTTYGTGDSNRKMITVKIDHNINDAHRLSGTYTYERARSQNEYVVRVWEDGWGGSVDRYPQTFTTVLTSTLTPTLLSEFRAGLSRSKTYDSSALGKVTDTRAPVLAMLQKTFPTDGSDGRVWKNTEVVVPSAGGTFPGPYGHFYGNATTTSWGSIDPRWTFSESLTWLKDAHSFKAGFEYRQSGSYQNDAGAAIVGSSTNIDPTIQGGVNPVFSPTGYAEVNGVRMPATTAAGPLTGLYGEGDHRWQGLSAYEMTDYGSGQTMGSKLANAYTLMNYMSGGVNQIWQYFYVVDSKDGRWNDLSRGENERYSDLKNREFSFFFKDDWKITSDLTLNLGVRWEYYGVPYEGKGKIGNVIDMENWAGMYGISRDLPRFHNDFATLNQAKYIDPNWAAQGTQQVFVGPNSPNPDMMAFNKDMNNWGPHVGFAWQLPWFGRGLTTLRGGYSVSYLPIGTFTSFRGLSSQPGVAYNYIYTGQEGCIAGETGCNMNFDNINQLLPLDMANTGQLPIGDPNRYSNLTNKTRDATLNIYDPNIRNAYVQNINLSVTRTLNSFLTLDLRYIGTLSRKALGNMPSDPSGAGYVAGTFNLNTPNYYENGLFDELQKLRSGTGDLRSMADFPLLNSIIPWKGQNDLRGVMQDTASLYAVYDRNGVFHDELSGAEQVLYHQFTNIARGAYQTVVNNLATADYSSALTGRRLRPTRPSVETKPGQVLNNHGAPTNLIYNNPQFERVNLFTNYGKSNYHSLQAQVTMRPTHGLSLQATWTWSRNLGRGMDILDYREDSPYSFEREYAVTGQHRLHSLNTYGTYTLPLGRNGYLFKNAAGAFQKAVEGWQLSWVASATSGAPLTFTGQSSMWDSNRVVQVGAFDANDVGVNWRNNSDNEYGRPYGTYFNKEYMWVTDPQCGDPSLVSQTTRNPYGAADTLGYLCGGNHASSLFALAEADTGTVVFRNAVPGEIGNKATRFLTGPGRWSLDMAMSKSIEFMEGKRLEIRMDAQNVLNHASPSFRTNPNPSYFGARNVQVSNPNIVLNDPNYAGGRHQYSFGYLNAKAGHRTFQGRIRISF